MDRPMDRSVLVREAGKHGLSRQVLRGSEWSFLSRGLYRPNGWDPDRPSLWLAMSRVLPPDSAAGHLTSAALHGWWLPQLTVVPPLFATTTGSTHVQRSGAYVRRSPRTRIEVVDGLRLVSAIDTVHELAADLAMLDLVPIIESACRFDAVTVDDILARAPPRMRGLRALRAAAELADPRSESWFESMLRIVHEFAGLEVEPQQEIRTPFGHLVARVDLRLLGTNRVLEYDGEHHRNRDRHVDDLRREKELGRLDLDRWGYTSTEIEHHPGQIVRDAEAALGLPYDPRRMRRWWREATMATVTASGRRRLAGRLEGYWRASRRQRTPASGGLRSSRGPV